jgi:hypothetical protein
MQLLMTESRLTLPITKAAIVGWERYSRDFCVGGNRKYINGRFGRHPRQMRDPLVNI